jgi:tRNA modification GTPase
MNEPPIAACRVARLTSAGRGAIAVISVEGHRAADVLARHFIPATPLLLERTPIGRIRYGRWTGVPTESEEVVVSRLETNGWEIHCHGGHLAPAAIIDSLVESGCQQVAASEWLERLSSNKIAAAAAEALSHAATPRVAGVLLDQYRGALANALQLAVTCLDEDNQAAARDCLRSLERFACLGLHLTRPWRVVVAGPPNAGKSSLVNAVLGFQRALVYEQPGTTRDVVTALTAVAGWPVELIDTAGLRTAANDVEREGVERARRQIADADLVLWVRDASAISDEPAGVRRVAHRSGLTVANKWDLLPSESVADDGELAVSALRGLGISTLLEAIAERLAPYQPAAGQAVPFTEQQVEAVRVALEQLGSNDLARARSMLEQLLVK